MSIEYRCSQDPRSRGAQCQACNFERIYYHHSKKYQCPIEAVCVNLALLTHAAPLEREKGLSFSYRYIAPLERKAEHFSFNRKPVVSMDSNLGLERFRSSTDSKSRSDRDFIHKQSLIDEE